MVIARFAHEGAIVRLAFTPDGSKLVSLAEDRTIKVWRTSDYSELQLWENQPDVATALAFAGDGASSRSGGWTARSRAYAIPAAAAGRDRCRRETGEAGGVDRNRSSSARSPSTSRTTRPDQANRLTAPRQITGHDFDGSAAGQVGCRPLPLHGQSRRAVGLRSERGALRSRSSTRSSRCSTARADRVPRVLLQAVRDSYFTFRGKDDTESGDFRVFNWQEMKLNEYLYANGEVVKLWLYPAWSRLRLRHLSRPGKPLGLLRYDSARARAGRAVLHRRAPSAGHEARSQRPAGLSRSTMKTTTTAIASSAKTRDCSSPPRPTASTWSRSRTCAGSRVPTSATRSPSASGGPTSRSRSSGADPTVDAGSAKEFKVTAQRIDDFEGPIRVDITGLPPGFSATTPVIDRSRPDRGVRRHRRPSLAAKPAADVAKQSKVTATGADRRSRRHATRSTTSGPSSSAAAPKLRVAIGPAKGGPRPINASSDQDPLEFAIEPGQTIMLKVKVERNGYKGQVSFGNEGSGRNLPFGVIVDNLGLNGLLLLEQPARARVLHHRRRQHPRTDPPVSPDDRRRGRPVEPAGHAAREETARALSATASVRNRP